MDRRQFFEKSGAAILSAYFLSACRSLPPGSSSYSRTGKAFVFLESKGGVSTARIVDLATLSHRDIEVPIVNPHSAQRIATSEEEFIVFDFMGSAVKANIKTGEILKAPNGTGVFMGHGTQTDDGKVVWCTEVQRNDAILVRARRTTDLSVITESHHEFPGGHHVTKLPDSDYLATGWYDLQGKFPAVRFFNRRTGESIILRLPEHITVSHLLPVSATEIVAITNILVRPEERKDGWDKNPIVQSTYESMKKTNNNAGKSPGRLDFDPGSPAPLIYANLHGETSVFWPEEDAELFRYGFSIDALPGTPKRFMTCHTIGNTVAIWSVNRTVEQYISVVAPKGAVVTPDGERLLILSLGRLKVWSLRDKKFVDEIGFERPIATLSRYS